jgi:uncharacterized membrane protein
MSEITRSIIVKADLSRAFNLWANFENFPRFMKYIKQVSTSANHDSTWVVAGPLGVEVEWTAEVTRMEPNQRIAWSTKDNAGDVTTSGQVTFQSLPDNQTQITVVMHYNPKGGVVGDIVASLFANPEGKLEEDLQNFKSYIEGRGGDAVSK